MRRIWTLTFIIVTVAVAVLALREYRKSDRVDARRTDPAVTDEQYAELLERMFAKLEYDQQAWHSDTQRAVEAVAVLADQDERRSPETYYALGLRLTGERRFVSAERAYRSAIEMRPGWSWPYSGLGLVLYELGRKEEAVKVFEEAMKIDPASPRPHKELSVLFRLDHRLDEAEKEAAIAVRLAPDRLDTLNTYANVLKEQGKIDEAREYYQKAISADPNHPTPYYNLACIHAEQGELDKTLELLRRAFRLEPSFAKFAREDRDLSVYRDEPRFRELLESFRQPAAS